MCKDCGCSNENGMITKVFHVPGMMCGNCKNTVEGASLGLPGVMSASVDLDAKDLTISFEPSKMDVEAITKAIEATGFDVETVKDGVAQKAGLMGTLKKLFK